MTKTPLLILSDAPTSLSGLGRITRELTSRIVANLSDTFRVATLGYGGVGSKDLPWQQYTMCGDPPARNWFVPELYLAWNDWAKDEKGVLLTIWDASRLSWLTDPSRCPEPFIRSWLASKPFDLWGYWPVDAAGINNKLPHGYANVMRKFRRNLAYSEWARGLMANEEIEAQALPHGIDTSIWYPRDRRQARRTVRNMGLNRLGDSSLLLGVVATNQARKDWALAFATAAELLKQKHDVLMWCHIDTLTRFWDIEALIRDFGLADRVMITQPEMKDDVMAELYSACDVTLGIGLGEGFGFPIFESLACGTPCVHGSCGGAAEWLLSVVPLESVRIDGPYNCTRPVFDAAAWAYWCIELRADNGNTTAGLPKQLDWNNLWPRWSSWLTEGVEWKSESTNLNTEKSLNAR